MGRILEEDGGGSARSGAVSWQCSDIAAGEGLDWRPSYALEESLGALWAAPPVRPEGGRAP